MRLPGLPDGAPRLGVIFGIPIVAFLLTLGLTLGFDDDGGSADQAAAAPTITVTVSASRLTPTPAPQPTASPTAEPTPVVLADRTDCDEVRGSEYRSDAERAWFQESCVPVISAPAVSAAPAVSSAPSGGTISGSSDRLVIPVLGIDAAVNYRTVVDGEMGNPLGAYDVVWYDFSAYGGALGGYPGGGGNAAIAGHVDYRGVGAAVFWRLRELQPGDLIEYYRGDGQVVRYVVQWISDVDPTLDFSPYVSAAAGDVMTLVTCNGDFDYANREYSHRRIVRAARAQ